MFYLIEESELKELKEGKIQIEDLTIPENIPLITWSGVDVRILMEKEGIKKDLREVIENVKHNLESCECAMCVECAMEN